MHITILFGKMFCADASAWVFDLEMELVVGRIADGVMSRSLFPGREYFSEDIEDDEGKDEKGE